MVQMYEDQPSFSSRLMGAGVNAAGQVGKAFLGEKLAQRQQQQMARQSEQENEQIKSNYGIDLSGIQDPKSRQLILAEKLKGGGKQAQHQEIKNTAQKSFDAAANLLKKGNIGLGSGVKSKLFGGQTAEDYGEFQSAMGGIESILVDMVSRGTLSNARFKYITETLLPSPGDRDRTIKGKLKALAELLDLDSGSLSGNKNKGSQSPDLFNMYSQSSERPSISSFGK